MSWNYRVERPKEETYWSKGDEKKKHTCTVCQKTCSDVFAKVLYGATNTGIFCSKACWDNRSHTPMSLRKEV